MPWSDLLDEARHILELLMDAMERPDVMVYEDSPKKEEEYVNMRENEANGLLCTTERGRAQPTGFTFEERTHAHFVTTTGGRVELVVIQWGSAMVTVRK